MQTKRTIFFISLLLTLIIAVSAVSAAEDTQISEDTLSEVSYTHTEETKITQDITNTQTNNKTITKNVKNNLKTDSENINYYVSDTTGSDENDGSQTTPFKTLQTAIDKTTTDNTYNIYINEGTYKGEGNVNLTVNGDNKINFIGSGVNKTIFDGEAQFTIGTSGSVWGGSGFWNTWSNVSGNWIMNITPGTGAITIQNFTIQNAWSNSGSSIAACPSATVDNYATLNATNIYFDSNHAGNGAGIRNHNGATLFVDNCTFINGTKAQSTGNYGAALYNNGTATIINTNIINNYARWGSVTNDKNITMINCTFKDNYAYDAGSGYKNGPSFTADTGFTNYFMPYAVHNLTSALINCTFDNNQQCDVSNGRGDLIVDNCVFNHSTGVFLFPNNNRANQYQPTQIISNNEFIDMQPSTVFATTISSTTPSVAVRANSVYNVTIENNTIDVPNTDYGYGIFVTANAKIINNTLNNYISLNGQNNSVVNNTIKTDKENTITLTNTAINNTIKDNTLYGGYVDGDLSIGNILATTQIDGNKPETDIYVINDENYTAFFDENSVARNDVLINGSKVIFAENLTNKDFIFDNIKLSIDVNTTLINATITTQNNAKVLFNNLKINTTRNDKDYVILLDSEGNTIKNANIQATTDKALQTIKIEEDKNIITGSTINSTAPAYDIKWNSDYSIGNVPTAGIFIRSSNNKINNSKIYLNAETKDPNSRSPSADGMDIQSKAVGEYVTGNEIRNTRINVTGGSYVYGLNIARAKETTTPLSYFDVKSDNYAAAIQVGDSENNNISGYIYSKATNTAYGYYSTAMATGATKNTNISKLYLQDVTAPNAVGVRIEGASNTELSSATYNVNGENAKAIEIVKDWMNNEPDNIYINALTVNLNGQNDTSALVTINQASNITINGSKLCSKNGQGIQLQDVGEASVTHNYINVGNLTGGDNAVDTTNKENTIYNNTPTIAILTDETYPQFFDENNTYYKDALIITVGGDLHDKILKFENITNTYNITNAANYTLYNSTIILGGNSSTYTGSYAINVENLNFENENKPVFTDELEGTIQKNVKFANTNITVTGDDIVAFDTFNNNSYIYLDVSLSNINMNGTNVAVANYSGYNRGQPIYIHDNNINITATEYATVMNAEHATIQLNKNNITINAKNAIVANLNDASISYYNYRYNNINVTADDAMALNMSKGDTYTAYISENEIRLKTKNPTTAINITGPRTVYVQNNNIVVDSENGETPVINVENPSSYVRNNYIVSKDTAGNNAVADTGITINSNTPTEGTFKVKITPEETTWKATNENNITFTITDDFDENITGTIEATIDGQEVPVNDNQITYTPTKSGNITLKITYTDPNGKYATTTKTVNIPVTKMPTQIEITAPEENTVNKTSNIIIVLKDENDEIITQQKINITIDNETTEQDIKNGFLIYKYTPTTTGDKEITITFEATETYDATTQTQTITVGPDKDKIIEELNETVNNQSKVIDELNDTVNNQSKVIDELNDTVNNQSKVIDELNDTVNNQTKVIDELNSTVNNQTDKIKELEKQNDNLQKQLDALKKQLDDIKKQLEELKKPKQTTITFDKINDAKFNGKVTIKGVLASEEANLNGQTITLTVNGKNVDVKTVNGAFEYTGAFTTIGEQTVTAVYKGTDKYVGSNNTTTFNVAKQDIVFSVDPVKDVKFGDKVTLTGNVKDADGNAIYNTNIAVKVNGKTYVAKTDKDGKFSVEVTANALENKVVVSYAGNNYYNKATQEFTVNAQKQDINIKVDAIKQAAFGDNVAVTGTVTDANGNVIYNTNVVVKVNGKVYSARTDKNGKFSVSVQATNLGSNSVEVSYGGNNYFNSASTTASFTAGKQDLVATVDTVKVSGKTGTVTGTLKDKNGNALYNTNVVVTVNGKAATATTSKTGVFTLSSDAVVAGSNTVTVAYGGNNYYNKVTLTKTLKA